MALTIGEPWWQDAWGKTERFLRKHRATGTRIGTRERNKTLEIVSETISEKSRGTSLDNHGMRASRLSGRTHLAFLGYAAEREQKAGRLEQDNVPPQAEVSALASAWESLCEEAEKRRSRTEAGIEPLGIYLLCAARNAIDEAGRDSMRIPFDKGTVWGWHRHVGDGREVLEQTPWNGKDEIEKAVTTWLEARPDPADLEVFLDHRDDARPDEAMKTMIARSGAVAGNRHAARYLLYKLDLLDRTRDVYANPWLNEETYQAVAELYLKACLEKPENLSDWPNNGPESFFARGHARVWQIKTGTLAEMRARAAHGNQRALDCMANIAECVNDDELFEQMFKKETPPERALRALPVATGRRWVALLNKGMDGVPNGAEPCGAGIKVTNRAFRALAMCDKRNLDGCTRLELLNLVAHHHSGFRQEGLRLAALCRP